ncbi:MAG TPA: lipoyl(octanoyl) transferase LipB [Chitinophagaceae bacterium]|nr:lipoyl(octanoyl) transferase LipB [Chitinophagaceae bacterium]
MQRVQLEDLGQMDYKTAWDYQEQLLQRNVAVKSSRRQALVAAGEPDSPPTQETLAGVNEGEDTQHSLLLVEHPPVYTLGKSGNINNVLISEEERTRRGIGFFYSNRGGDITFHGPQQLVVYPVFDLEKFYTDIGRYLRNLEQVIIDTIEGYGLRGERSAGETGVWLDPGIKGKERKICAIGVRCSRWITMHGLAFNVNTDLSYFDNIIPCGIQNKQVTSLARELGHDLPLAEVKEAVKRNFEKVFDIQLQERGV